MSWMILSQLTLIWLAVSCGQVSMPHLHSLHLLLALPRMMKSKTRKLWRLWERFRLMNGQNCMQYATIVVRKVISILIALSRLNKSSRVDSSPLPRHVLLPHLLLNPPACPTRGVTIQRIKRQKQSGQLPSRPYLTTIASTTWTATMAMIAMQYIKTRMNCLTTKRTRTCAAFFLWLVI